ncbi:unnamed protein product [Prunus brigantina]
MSALVLVSFQASEGSLPKGSCDVIGAFRREGVTSSRIARSPSKLRKGSFRREVMTSSCLPKGREGVTSSRVARYPSKFRKGAFRREGVTSSRVARSPSKLRRGAFRREVVTEGVTSSRVVIPFTLWKGAFRKEVVTSRVPCGSGIEASLRGNRGIPTMSDNSERESQSPPSPHAFSGEEFESGSHNEDLGLDGESTGSEGVGEGLIVEGGRVGEEEHASGRVGPSGFGTVVVASADVGVPVGVPLPKKNMMSLYELESLKVDYVIPECVGLRLPIPAEAARYPPEGCVMVFSAMYKHGLRLPLHPWVQMMLSRLGYDPGQYNPNFWCILHGVYIAWWLAKRGEPSFEQFMHLYSVSRQQGNFGWVQVNCRKAKERAYFIGQPPSSQKTWRNRWFFAFGDWECWPGKTVSKHVPTQFQSIGSVKCRLVSREEED